MILSIRPFAYAAAAAMTLFSGACAALPSASYAPVDEQPIAYQKHFEAMAEQRALAAMGDEELLRAEGLSESDDVEQLLVARSLKKTLAQEPQQFQTLSASIYSAHSAAYHQVYEVNPLGDVITLWDGSQWVVNPKDQATAVRWGPRTPVVISPHSTWLFSSGYKFRLVHRESGEYLRVNMTRGPHVSSGYFRYITFIDYLNGDVWLNDGSIWRVSDNGKEMLGEWQRDQVVVIGVNDGWFSFKPNILLNVTRYSYLPAKIRY